MADTCGLDIAAGLKGTGQERAKNFATNKLNMLRDRVFNVSVTTAPSIEQLQGKEKGPPSVNVKLEYFPSGGDPHWKLLFEHANAKDRWSPVIPKHFEHITYAEVWDGVTWEYRKQGTPRASGYSRQNDSDPL